MEVFIPWLHWLSKLDIFSCINNIWNFSLVIISCWFLKGVLRCWSLSQSFQLFWVFSAFEWKSQNSFRMGMYVCVQACVIMYYIKLLKRLQVSDTFWSQKTIAFCARDRGTTLPVCQVMEDCTEYAWNATFYSSCCFFRWLLSQTFAPDT